MAYLNEAGLTHFWRKIIKKFPSIVTATPTAVELQGIETTQTGTSVTTSVFTVGTIASVSTTAAGVVPANTVTTPAGTVLMWGDSGSEWKDVSAAGGIKNIAIDTASAYTFKSVVASGEATIGFNNVITANKDKILAINGDGTKVEWRDISSAGGITKVNGTSPITVSTSGSIVTVGVSNATTATVGVVKVGNNISVSSGEISIPTASASTAGVVKIGNNISISDEKISVPIATASTLGVVKIGNNISVSTAGEISVKNASTTNAGVIKIGTTAADAAAGNHTHSNATTATSGFMSAADKTKLDGVSTGANKVTVPTNTNGIIEIDSTQTTVYTHPTVTSSYASGLYKITTNTLGHVISATAAVKSDITVLGIPGNDSVISGTVTVITTGATTLTGTVMSPVISLNTYTRGEIDTKFAGVAHYKGAITSYSAITVPYSVGDYWVVNAPGTYAGKECENGDMIFANTTVSEGGTKSDNHFDIVQTNITAMTNQEIDNACNPS